MDVDVGTIRRAILIEWCKILSDREDPNYRDSSMSNIAHRMAEAVADALNKRSGT